MNGTPKDSVEERRKYVTAFNDTMIKIWREQIALLGVIDTGALYRSTLAVGMNADGKYTSVRLEQSFNTYGLFVDYGTTHLAAIPETLAATTSANAAGGSRANISPR